jgi:Cdc6-like AAA superfamily ATPase
MDYSKKFASDFKKLDENYRQPEKFIKNMARSTDKFRALILQGAPGVGKTYSVEQALNRYAPNRYELINGKTTMLSLYGCLYRASKKGHILFLDDCDSVFADVNGINLLKAAMDTKPNREIHWESSSAFLKALDIPSSFNFDGAVILNTNIGYDNHKEKFITRLSALHDRALTITISNNDADRLFKQVCYMVLMQDMLASYKFTNKVKNELLEWIDSNRDRIKRISLRTIIKLSNIYSVDKKGWREMAEQGLLFEANDA